MDHSKPLTLKQAAGIAGVSPDTVARWCKRYRIGKQLHPNSPWRVDPIGLAIVVAGDGDALSEYQRSHLNAETEAAICARDGILQVLRR